MREKLENLIQNILRKMESVQNLNAEKENQNVKLLEKLNQKEMELGEIASKISLKSQIKKILLQINQNLGNKKELL